MSAIPRDPWLRLLDYMVTLRAPASEAKTERIRAIEAVARRDDPRIVREVTHQIRATMKKSIPPRSTATRAQYSTTKQRKKNP